jgi:poly(ADP-ribose) glycohydrolase ARH3
VPETGALARFRGALIGGAVGDAIGELAGVHGDRKSLLDWLDEGDMLRYTDDTAMSIGLAEALTAANGVDEQLIGETFKRNYGKEPWRDYSSSTPAVFATARRHEISFAEAAQRLHGGEGSYGNGAAMRIAPFGVLFRHSSKLRQYAEIAARVTHAHPVGIDGAAVMAWAVALAARSRPNGKFPFADFVMGIVGFAQTKEMRLKLAQVVELIAKKTPPNEAAVTLKLSQKVHESLPFSIYAFLRHPTSYQECLFTAVLNGGDEDTLGAMAGALSGAYLGIDAIPKDWQERLENRDHLEALAERLSRMDAD